MHTSSCGVGLASPKRGYVIARIDIKDPKGYETYAQLATAAIVKYGGRLLVRGGRHEAMDGDARARNVVIEFESFERAREYYMSPEYQLARQERILFSIGEVVIVEGVA